jgi:DNA-binding response OmpR family regulator
VAGFKDRSVEVYIHKLRVKLGDAAPKWRWIHTHHAIGYRLEPEPQEDRS